MRYSAESYRSASRFRQETRYTAGGLKTVSRIIAGFVIGIVPWLPVILGVTYVVSLYQAILSIAGVVAGTVIIAVAIVKWTRYGGRHIHGAQRALLPLYSAPGGHSRIER